MEYKEHARVSNAVSSGSDPFSISEGVECGDPVIHPAWAVRIGRGRVPASDNRTHSRESYTTLQQHICTTTQVLADIVIIGQLFKVTR